MFPDQGRWLPLLLSLLILLPACGPRPTVAPARPQWVLDWLDQSACVAPCWEGIAPGVTGRGEVVTRLQSLTGIGPLEGTASSLITWRFGDGGNGLVALDDTDTVAYTVLNLDPSNAITLSEVLASFGAPSHVRVRPGTELANRYDVEVIFLEQGIIAGAWMHGGVTSVSIEADQPITSIMMFVPGSAGYVATGRPTAWVGEWAEWHGYAEYAPVESGP
jgi:hypothetical protein